jgi:hypothetical protein
MTLLYLDPFGNSGCSSYEGRYKVDLLYRARRQLPSADMLQASCACVITVVCCNGYLPFVAFDDFFRCCHTQKIQNWREIKIFYKSLK